MKGYLWLTIGRLVAAGLVPGPKVVAPDESRLHIKVRTPSEVDRWKQHLGLPPATTAGYEYGSVDFLAAPGWCGYTTVRVYCDLPAGVPT